MLNAERALASLDKSGEALTGILEENANIEHRTPNFQRRTEENQREKDNAFSLFLSPLLFDVRRSMLNAERALASLEKSSEALTGIAGGNVRCSYYSSGVRCSMFDVRVYSSDVRCSMFDVRIHLQMRGVRIHLQFIPANAS